MRTDRPATGALAAARAGDHPPARRRVRHRGLRPVRPELPLTWQRIVLFACVPLVIEVVAIGMASRVLRRPLAELGEMDIEAQVAIRSG